ncbi:MAG TPA: DUF4198 domain-containing protein [Candidatus Krumholzibacteria bacterium]|nr:DUF4198 domain-containing protein [Candidatus Krumholzibacteria bacterium]HRX50100.1 DUF4198 domain-containing protein [Candidatus Krumholzibacteria bacterium]
MPLAPRPLLIVLLALLAVPGAGRAHDLMLTAGPDGLRVLVGHPAGAEHGAPTSDLPDSLLAAAWTLDDAGPLPITSLTQPLPCPAAARGAVASVDWGAWAATDAGRLPLAQARPTDILATSRARATVALLRGPLSTAPTTPDLFILPLGDPTAARPGDKIRVRILRDGAPCPGATVLVDGDPRGASGADGELNLRLRHGGAQLLQAVWRGPDPAGQVDELILETSLTFRIEE